MVGEMRPLPMHGRALLAAVVLAGCVSAPAPAPEPATPALVVVEGPRIDATQTAREPSLVAAPDGTLYVAGYWGPVRYAERPPATPANAASVPLLWRSADAGATWERLDLSRDPLARGNSDVSLAVDADGRLYYASLSFGPPGYAIAMGASADRGATWRWSLLSAAPYADRPWVRIAPDGAAHVVWNDGDGVHHAESTDGGATWTARPRVSPTGGSAGFAISQSGALAVRVVPIAGGGLLCAPDTDGVAVSTDDGESWTMRDVPGTVAFRAEPAGCVDDGPVRRVWDPVAFAGDTLATAWSDGATLWMERSDDLGATWRATAVAEEGGSVPFFPFVRAGAGGALAVTWFADVGGTVAARAAIVHADLVRGPVTLLDDTGSADHGEYFESDLLANGTLVAAVPTFAEGGQWLETRTVRGPRS